jgi:hypothetical protein
MLTASQFSGQPASGIGPHRIAGEHLGIIEPTALALECPMLETLRACSNVNRQHSNLAFRTTRTLNRKQFGIRFHGRTHVDQKIAGRVYES